MKFNLKNRPKASQILETMTKNQLMDYIEEMWKWFEGFEKELREKWEKLDCESDLELGQSMIIREILGES